VGFFLLFWIHAASVVSPILAWSRARHHPGSATLLAFGLSNLVLVLTSQFSNFFFVGFPWVFLGMSLAAVDVWSTAQPEREREAPAVPA
jgi:CHASE2 domain-containing sensor protein